MTIKQYLNDHQTRGTVKVTEIISGEKLIIRLAETWFHPQGGGQKADRGTINNSNVIHVTHNGNYVDHYVDSIDGIEIGREYTFQIDEMWRLLNAVYHTAGHLIAGVLETTYPTLTAVSGHQWPGEARVEFERSMPMESISGDHINLLLSNAIGEKLPVKVVGDPFTSRAIKIGDFKEIPCGGTHVESLEKIGKIIVTGIKTKSNRLRLSYETSPNI